MNMVQTKNEKEVERLFKMNKVKTEEEKELKFKRMDKHVAGNYSPGCYDFIGDYTQIAFRRYKGDMLSITVETQRTHDVSSGTITVDISLDAENVGALRKLLEIKAAPK